MPAPIFLKIDVTKLKKEWFFKADSGAIYADLALYANDELDKFGNTHAIKQNPPKAVKDNDPEVKGHYVGNGKALERKGQGSTPPARRPNVPPPSSDMSNSDVPWD
jgi:hypothetical protein